MHCLQVRCDRIPASTVRIPQIRHSNASPLSGQRTPIDKVSAKGGLTQSEEHSELTRFTKAADARHGSERSIWASGHIHVSMRGSSASIQRSNNVWNDPNRAEPRGRGGFEL